MIFNRLKFYILFILILVILFFNSQKIYCMQNNQIDGKYIIKDISVQGNTKTKTKIILQELEIKIGQIIDNIEDLNKLIKKSEQNLINWQIFSNVEINYEIKNEYEVYVFINIVERWTLFPVPGYGYNTIYGSTYSFSFTDANFFGYHINFGTIISYNTYQKQISINFGEPRLFGSFYSFYLYFLFNNYLNTLYENNDLLYKSNIYSYYIYANLSKKLNDLFTLYLDLNLEYCQYNTQINAINLLEPNIKQSLLGIGLIYQNIKYRYAIKDGKSIEIYASISPFNLESLEFKSGFEILFYKIFLNENMFCFRFNSFYYFSKLNNFEILDYLDIRGTKNGEIFGNYGFYGNIELHFKLFTLMWPFPVKFYIPIFIDIAFLDNDKNAVICGIGLKLYPEPIYLTLRLDFSINITNYLKNNQYFFFYFYTCEYF